MAYMYEHIPGTDFVPVFASAVLDGLIPGEVQERQGSLLISLTSGIHYAAGRAGEGSFDLLAGKLDEAEKNGRRFTLFSGSANWINSYPVSLERGSISITAIPFKIFRRFLNCLPKAAKSPFFRWIGSQQVNILSSEWIISAHTGDPLSIF